jgi:hypothetical protein
MKDLNDHYPIRSMDVCTNPDLPEDQIDILGSDFAMFQSSSGQFKGNPKQLQNKRAPSGASWVENNPTVPSVCPGEIIKARTYLAVDHNGVFAWSKKNSAGQWKQFTEWRSINNDPHIKYFNIDGQPWEANQCGANDHAEPSKSNWVISPQKWSKNTEHCRSLSTFEYDLQIPADAPEGRFQMMFTYMGGMDKDSLQNIHPGVPMSNPEKALFISCTFVNVKSGCHNKPDEPTISSTVAPTPEPTKTSTAEPSGSKHHEGIPDIDINVNVVLHV